MYFTCFATSTPGVDVIKALYLPLIRFLTTFDVLWKFVGYRNVVVSSTSRVSSQHTRISTGRLAAVLRICNKKTHTSVCAVAHIWSVPWNAVESVREWLTSTPSDSRGCVAHLSYCGEHAVRTCETRNSSSLRREKRLTGTLRVLQQNVEANVCALRRVWSRF